MDGTSAKSVVNKPGITELAVDYGNKRIYWINANHIESSDYDGRNQKIILSNENPVRSLTATGNQIFWYEPPKLFKTNSTIWTCNSENCGNY